MGLGVLESKEKNVPGTEVILDDDQQTEEVKETIAGLKYDRSGKVPIVLVPQPSDDPNDPLNWSLRKRDGILAILCLISVLASTLSPLLAANSFQLVFLYQLNGTEGIDFTKIALLTGYHLLGVGVAGLFFVATGRVWGKRHLYLLGTAVIIASSAWGGASGYNYDSLLWARVFQGVGLAPFEALVNASVGDLYFVHQRGARMAASNLALFGGAFFTPIIVGKITDSMGWQWTFYFLAIFTGATLPLIIFFVPETAFRREPSKQISSGSGSTSFDDPTGTNGAEEPKSESTQVPAKVPYWQTLKPFNGRKTDENVFQLIFRPIPLFLHPAILWACLTQGTLIGWTVLIGVYLAAVFFGPPLFFTELQTGYLYTGPFVGAVLGFILAGLVSDWSTKRMIRANKGVYEPEFRILPLVGLQLIAGCAGLYGFGYATANVYTVGAIVPDVCFAFEVMGMVLGAVASALYVVDAHPEIAVEAFTCLLMFKNIFSYALTYKAFEWLEGSANTTSVFNVIGSIQVGICLLSIPMYVFGKRNRAFTRRYDILKMLHLGEQGYGNKVETVNANGIETMNGHGLETVNAHGIETTNTHGAEVVNNVASGASDDR